MVGNPKKRLKEDALRILRAIRFATILNFRLDENLKKYIKKYGYLLTKLSYDRKRSELEKIFTSSNASYGVQLIKELMLFDALELSNIESLVITPSLIGIWAQLEVDDIYKFSKQDKKIIEEVKELLKLDLYDSKVLYKYGLYSCSIAAEILNVPKKIITKKYNDLVIHNKNDIEISGNDIANILNKPPGNYISQIINDLEEVILEEKVQNNFLELKQYVIDKYLNVQN
jgi:tRNA nucleotidyltransferase (CCA-adding enzyme)